MEIVKKHKNSSEKKRESRLKGLLFKKEIMERQIKVAEHGANLSCAYAQEMESRIKELETGKSNPLEQLKLKYELLSVKRDASDYISDFKEFKSKYERGLIKEIKTVTDEEQFSKIEFDDIEKKAKELAHYELYGKVAVKPENVELVEVLKGIEDYISILNTLVTATKEELSNNLKLSNLEKAKLQKDLFDYSMHLQTLSKRLSKRQEYYINQFLPVYEKDMKECAINLESYLKIAQAVAQTGIDPLLKGLLESHEKYKTDSEHLWTFYNALKNRLKLTAEYVSKNKKRLPELAVYLRDFIN